MSEPRRDSLELHVPEPDPPRRSGCLSVLSLALLLAITLGIGLAFGEGPTTVPEQGEARLVLEPLAAVQHEEAVLGARDCSVRTLEGRRGCVSGNESDRLGYRDEVTRRSAVLAGQSALSEPRRFAHADIVASGGVGSALVSGYATFYSDPSQRIDHYAAAGPLLRDALGHWRGKVIRVTSGNRSTIVRLADFCACGERHGLPTLLDLSPEAFRDLASLSAGIVRVEIELVELPATDALPRNATDLRMMLEVRDDAAYR